MKLMPFLLAITGAAAVIGARGSSADACTIHGNVQVVTYWDDTSTYNPPVSNDLRCNQSGGGQTCKLQGYYITPSPTPSGALPTVVFIHGSGPSMPGLYCETLNAFVDRGYVVFAPVMRGVAGSLGGAPSFATNTGQYIETYASNNATASCDVVCQTLSYMTRESRDIDSAFHWLVNTHPNRTDLSRIALIGHSYGGATVTIAQASTSNLTFVPTVTVSLSGAAMSWSPNGEWASGMDGAADHARAPMYFQRVVNESPLYPDPTTEIGSALETYNHVVWSGEAARLASYSAYAPATNICNDTNPNWHNVHCAFVNEPAGVAIWIDGVVAFLQAYGIQ